MPLVLCCSASAAPVVPHALGTGASLAVEDHARAFLTSPDASFSCGFRQAGENAFTFSVWYTDAVEKTAVWTASPGDLVNGRASRITFRRDGDLALVDANGTTVWDTKTKGRDLSLSLLDTGNLVITDAGRVVWQSFDSPTDTLVPTQPLTKDTRLVAGGGFVLYYDHTNNLLRLLYDGPAMSSNYWPNPDNNAYKNNRITYNSSRLGVLDDAGVFQSSDNLTVVAADLGQPGAKRRLTVGHDGNARIYSLNNGEWTVTWAAMAQPCSAHGLCGENALCEYVPRLRCSCPAGFEMVDRRDWGKGCRPLFAAPSCSSESKQRRFKFVKMPHTDFYGYDLAYTQSVSFESCERLCLDNCLCAAFSYRVDGRGLCFPKFRLFNGFRSASFFGNIYLKVPFDSNVTEEQAAADGDGTGLACAPNDEPQIVPAGSPDTLFATPGRNDTKWSYFFVFVGVLGLLDLLFIMTGWWFLSSKHSLSISSLEAGGYRTLAAGQFRRFTYRELKDATGNFREELGRGGSGVVYRGVLEEGKKVVAVKKLTNVMAQGDEEFWAEMMVIRQINHINLVRTWGFCSDVNKRSKMLVYEYVDNESLDKHLFVTGADEERPPLPWRERYMIALGMARGLAYLHHECLEWVIHCDVKPENILLTREFEAKIADFGLAKLSNRKQQDGGAGVQLSRMRGTTGYMAPEWALNLPINAKVDVYSYGVVLLEIVIGKRVSNQATPDGEPLEMQRIVQALSRVVDTGDVARLVDGRLQGQFNPRQALEMVRISMACLEERSSSRPTMDDVAKALTAYDDEDEHPAYKS